MEVLDGGIRECKEWLFGEYLIVLGFCVELVVRIFVHVSAILEGENSDQDANSEHRTKQRTRSNRW